MSEPRRYWWHIGFIGSSYVVPKPYGDERNRMLNISNNWTELVEADDYDALAAELEILKSKASQFESTLKETMRVRDAEIEKLKRVVDVLKIQRCRLLSEKFAGFPLNAMNAESELDKELEAIEKGEL